jgi:hypothetical protein
MEDFFKVNVESSDENRKTFPATSRNKKCYLLFPFPPDLDCLANDIKRRLSYFREATNV